MSAISGIIQQLQVARTFSRMALKGLEADLWKVTPAHPATNVNWQLGHIVLANYHFGIELIVGRRADLIDVSSYTQWYHRGTLPGDGLEERPGKSDLIAAASRVDAAIDEILSSLDEGGLSDAVSTFNPMITTKHASLLFCGAHQMYHNGQLGLLRKALLGN